MCVCVCVYICACLYVSMWLGTTSTCGVPLLSPSEARTRGRWEDPKPLDRRFSNDSTGFGWTNGWTASSMLSDNVHGKLFGDALVSESIERWWWW
ncbi:hypothetical protein BDF14DRAFT_1858843 [Spinellus fusiger]|nr:hypothetical protein BDF14DRAFT_1858843 [Spinellus fusiger]